MRLSSATERRLTWRRSQTNALNFSPVGTLLQLPCILNLEPFVTIAMLEEENKFHFTFHKALLKKELKTYDDTHLTKIRKQTLLIQTTDFKIIEKSKQRFFSPQGDIHVGHIAKHNVAGISSFEWKKDHVYVTFESDGINIPSLPASTSVSINSIYTHWFSVNSRCK